jgi:hypothetical protein
MRKIIWVAPRVPPWFNIADSCARIRRPDTFKRFCPAAPKFPLPSWKVRSICLVVNDGEPDIQSIGVQLGFPMQT